MVCVSPSRPSIEPPPLLREGGRDHDGAAHRGVLAGLCLVAARRTGDPRVPPTSLEVRFTGVATLSVPAEAERLDALRVAVTMRGEAGGTVAEGIVELAGHDVGPRVADLVELAHRKLAPAVGRPTAPGCWGCGTGGPLQRRPLAEDTVVATVALDDRATTRDGRVDPSVVTALVTCPATWLAEGRPPDHLVVRFFGHATAYEPLRLVARRDPHAARSSRAALLDDDGAVVAVAATRHGS